MKIAKCPICGDKFKSPEGLYDHVGDDHESEIPNGYTPAQYIYYIKTGKTSGRCVECGKETTWNTTTNKYNRFCGNPKCKDAYVKRFQQRMIDKYGKTNLLNEPDQQRKMLANRKISGSYKWSDGKTKQYTGSYEKDFLKFLDVFMNFESDDIMAPSPHTYYYNYEGEKKFYIPDVYIPSLNLEIEVKDGGDNPNKHHKIQDVDKVKEKLKDKVMMGRKDVNYIKVVDKKYDTFINYLLDKKNELIYKNPSEIVDESLVYKAFSTPDVLYHLAKTNTSYVKNVDATENAINRKTLAMYSRKLSHKVKGTINVFIYDSLDSFEKGLATNRKFLAYKKNNQQIIGLTDNGIIHVLSKKAFKSLDKNGSYEKYLHHELIVAIVQDINPNCANYIAECIATVLSGELDEYTKPDKILNREDGLSQILSGSFLIKRIMLRKGTKELKRIIRDGTRIKLLSYIKENNILDCEDSNMYSTLTEATGMDPSRKYPVYVVLFSNDTTFGRLIRKVTGSEYSHAAISLDPSLNKMYSFSSVPYNHSQFGEGFVRESLWSPMFEENRYFTVMVCFVDKEARDRIQQKINTFERDYMKYRYNDVGLIKYYLNFTERRRHDESRKHKYFCSEFVAYMLKVADFEEYDDIMLAPEEIMERSILGTTIGNYTIPEFNEKDLQRKTYKAYKELCSTDLDEYFKDELKQYGLMRESSTNVNILQEGRIKDIVTGWYKSFEKWYVNTDVTKYMAIVDWKKIYETFTKLFKGNDPKKRFDIVELILHKFLIPLQKNARKTTDLIVAELHRIYNSLKKMTSKIIISKTDTKNGLLYVNGKKKTEAIEYPRLKPAKNSALKESDYSDVDTTLSKSYDATVYDSPIDIEFDEI